MRYKAPRCKDVRGDDVKLHIFLISRWEAVLCTHSTGVEWAPEWHEHSGEEKNLSPDRKSRLHSLALNQSLRQFGPFYIDMNHK